MKYKTCFRWGVTAVASVCAILVFYDTFFQNGVLLIFGKKLIKILNPVLYGLAMAYLLAPIVNFFERFAQKRNWKLKPARLRAASVTLTWLLVLVTIYLLFGMLIPELAASIQKLLSNLETYYNTIYSWAVRLMEDNPDISDRVLKAVSKYYNEMVSWVYNKWIPQAQVAVAAVTGGVVTVLVFFKDLLVGLCVSIYLLGRKETFAAHTRKLLYSMVTPVHYDLTLRSVSAADRIFSGFVRGKLLDSLIIGILCFVFSTLFRFPYAPLVSVIVGVTNIIPFFGPFLGAVPSAFLILLDSPVKCLYFVLFVLVLQQFDGNFLGPKILGGSTGLSGFWVIVAILVGGGFFGVLGMFLGVPVFACIHTAIRTLSENSLRNKGIEDDAMFTAKPSLPTSENNKENTHD